MTTPAPPAIFCPACDALILDAARCPACGWERLAPPPSGPPGELWRAELPAPLASSLTLASRALASRALYGCDEAGKFHALSAETGRPLWPAVDLGSWRIHRRVAVAEERVLLAAYDVELIARADKAVIALDAATGREAWRAPTGARHLSDPAVAGDLVVVGTNDGHCLAFDLATGAPRGAIPLHGRHQAAPAVTPAAADALFIFGNDKGALTAVRRATLAHAWTFRVEPHPQWPADLPYTPLVAGERIYVTCWNCRCYCLEATTGKRIWASEPTKRPPLTPPVLHRGRIYFSAHDRYVYCLAADTGALLWKQQLPRRANTTPVALDGGAPEGVVFVASEDHHLYAFDAATGAALDAPAVRTERHVAVDWASAEGVAYLADAGGTVVAVALRPKTAPRAAAEWAQAGDWPAAAAAWALEGDLPSAARIYAQLGQPRHAALLYAHAGDAEHAATHFEAAGELLAAREWFARLGRLRDVARLSLALRDLPGVLSAMSELGRRHEAAGEWAGAAQAYEAAGELLQAAAMRERAGEWAAAARLCAQLGEHRRAAELFEQAGESAAAAGEWAKVATEWRAVGRWLAAGQAHEAAGELVLAAEAFREAGACDRAADCLRRAAESAEARGVDGEHVAGLYDAAMAAYIECGAEDRAAACDRARRWRRGQPWLTVPLPRAEAFVAGESGRVDFSVLNEGWGLARDILLTVSGRVALDLTRAQRPFSLQEGAQPRTQSLWVIPERGGRLPLHLTVTCKDKHGEPMPPFEISYEIVVRSAKDRRGDGTTIIQVDRIIQAGGDYVEGDQAKFDRRVAVPAPAPPEPAASEPVGQNICKCGHTQPADRAKCSACGRPFYPCRACGRHQVSLARHCPNCGAAN